MAKRVEKSSDETLAAWRAAVAAGETELGLSLWASRLARPEKDCASPENITAARFSERAFDFVRSASVICCTFHYGLLPSAALLLGNACELLAKRRLLHMGVATEKKLRNQPYGHDIFKMWKDDTSLFEEAEQITREFQKNPSASGVDANFSWSIHFEQLAKGHSRDGNYSNRYHEGEKKFADPKAVSVVLAEICRREQEKSVAWSDGAV